MTPLSSVDASGLPGPVIGGVLLEPEGTTFLVPATLSLAGGPVADPAILQGDAHGDVRLVVPSGDAWSTVEIEHFSPGLSADPKDPAWQRRFQEAQKDDSGARRDAARLLKQPIEVPDPPSVPAECRDDAAWRKVAEQVNAFTEQVRQPESGLLRRMLEAERLREEDGSKEVYDFAVEKQLVERLVAKAFRLVTTTARQPEKWLAVGPVVLRIAKDAQLLGVNADELLAAIRDWQTGMIDGLLRRIREEHDYQWAVFAWEFSRQAALLGSEIDTRDLLTRLQKAMTFEATLRFNLDYPRQSWVTGADAIRMIPNPSYEFIDGTGQGTYMSYSSDSQEPFLGKPFRVEARLINVDFCAGTAKFGVSRMNSDTETYVIGNALPMELALVDRSWIALFKDSIGAGWLTQATGGGTVRVYGFEVKLHKKNPRWISETVEGNAEQSNGKVKGTFEITVLHAPAGGTP